MEWQLFEPGTVPEWTTREWYAGRVAAPHLEQEGHRERLLVAARFTREALLHYDPEMASVVDLGAGDGGLLSVIRAEDTYPPRAFDVWGYDLQPSNIDAARRRSVDVELLDVVAEWPRTGEDCASIVIATEFFEHLINPHEMARRIADSPGVEWLIASSPYTETANSHYEFHTWAWDLNGYRDFLEANGWEVLKQETAWIAQVVLARRAP